MNLETFFEKFDLFADCPNDVQKMRELILELAVQGKLVEQADGVSALEELGASRRQMLELITSGIAKKERPANLVSKEEEWISLPTGWAWCRMVDLGQFINGAAFKPSDWSNTGRPIIRIQNLSGRSLDFNKTTRQVEDVLVVRRGDILVSWSATLDAYIWQGEEGVLNQHIFRVLPSSAVDRDFLFWLLKHSIKRLADSEHAHGLVMAHINRGPFLALPIALPPLVEQKRIVAKVDELMALCDALEAQQKERETKRTALAKASLAAFTEAPSPQSLELLFHSSYAIDPADLRKSILTLAVQGKLVEQREEEGVAQDLVERVRLQKERLVLTKAIKKEIDTDDLPPNLEPHPIPDSWMWVRAGDLCYPISSGSTPDQSVFQSHPGVPYLKVYNIRDQKIDFGYKPQFINETFHRERLKRSILRPGDVVMNIVGPPLGKTAIIPMDFPEWNCNQAISFFRLIESEIAHYLHLFLCQGSFIDGIQLIGTAGQDNISVTKCKAIPVPLPPLAEQKRIVAKVDELMALVDRLEAQEKAARETASRLLEAMVAELSGRAAE